MKNLLAYLTTYKAKKAQLESLQAEVDAMKDEIEKYTMANNTPDEKGKYKFSCGQYIITVTPCEKTWIDKTALEKDLPDIAKKYEKATEYNRTTVR